MEGSLWIKQTKSIYKTNVLLSSHIESLFWYEFSLEILTHILIYCILSNWEKIVEKKTLIAEEK